MTSHPRLSVIVPAFRAANMLRQCAEGLFASDLQRDAWELIVVDDGSHDGGHDGTFAIAQSVADIAITVEGGPRGPATARNLGALSARGDILVFVDVDVVVARETLSGFAREFDRHPGVSAIFGAYDSAPASRGFISQYRNLLHRYVHLQHPGEARSFWAGCGAIRREVFLSAGGFDASRYPRPQIEDIEFGYRLVEQNQRILLDPSLTGKHLKHWDFVSMVRTDFRDRAVPWMHLLLERSGVSRNTELNLGASEKFYTCCMWLVILCAFFTPFDQRFLWPMLLFLGVVVAGNVRLFQWFARERGLLFALGIIPLRLLYYIIGGAGAAWAVVTHRWQPRFASPQALPNRFHHATPS